MFYGDNVAVRFAESLFRHRRLFIIAVLTVTLITAVGLSTRGHTWQATALTQVKTADASQLGDQPRVGSSTPAQENVNQFTDLMKDNLPDGFLDKALRSANLANPVNVDPKAKDPRYAALSKSLTVTPTSDTLFSIALTWDNPRECERIVAALQRQYIAEVGLDRSAQSIATVHFLDSQIHDYEARMRTAEQQLVNFKQQSVGRLPEEQTARITQLGNLEVARDNALITQQDAALKMATLKQRLTGVSPYTILEQSIAESPLLGELLRLKAQRDTMLAKYRPNHPTVLALNDQIANLEKDLRTKSQTHAPEASSIVGTRRQDNPLYVTLQQQYVEAGISEATQRAQLTEINRQIDDYKAGIARMPQDQRELTNMTREDNLLKTRYEVLVQKRQEVAMQGALAQVSVRSTLTPIGRIYAEPSLTPVKAVFIGLGSVVLGLIVGVLLLILGEWGDRSLRYPGDAERLLGVPVLAILPENAEIRTLSAGSRVGRAGSQSGRSREELKTSDR